MSWDTAAGSGGGGWDAPAATNSFHAADEFAAEGGPSYGGEDAGADGFRAEGGGNDGACFNCGEQGHSKRDCPAPRKSSGGCFNCGEESHSKAECTNPTVAREFTGTCRLCEQQGHRAADCPSAPPKICKNCAEEGHGIAECKNPRKISYDDIEDVSAEKAWEEARVASDERDLDDFKVAIKKYLKAVPDTTYSQLESAFRSQNFNVYLIAMEKELAITYTNMDLQGNLDKKYTVSYRLSPKHQRPKEKDAWPKTPEENLTRLADAGEAVDRGIPKCSNCEQLGHTMKACREEKRDTDQTQVKCFNCEEVGHRVRDCPNPRPDKFACRNCKQSGHSAKECTEPRSAEGVECKKCGGTGHFAKDCPQGGGSGECRNCGKEGHRAKDCTEERKIICRNCDEEGHVGKDCPKPRDYSRVQCINCKQMGHTKTRCKEPIVEDDAAEGAGGFGGDSGGYGAETADGGDFSGGQPASIEQAGW